MTFNFLSATTASVAGLSTVLTFEFNRGGAGLAEEGLAEPEEGPAGVVRAPDMIESGVGASGAEGLSGGGPLAEAGADLSGTLSGASDSV